MDTENKQMPYIYYNKQYVTTFYENRSHIIDYPTSIIDKDLHSESDSESDSEKYQSYRKKIDIKVKKSKLNDDLDDFKLHQSKKIFL